MEKNIMLAFVSPVSGYYLSNPITYPDVQGRAYTAIQTNESAIVYVERMLTDNPLAKIFLIASDAVQNEKAPSENEFGNVTHLEFLKRRVIKECPQLAEKFSVHAYSEVDDVSTALEKNILQTAEIADAVMKFARENSPATIKIHADMTGGFRHASMLMLSIIQLLKYRGVEIGEVLYSDPKSKTVYSVTEIQQMFSLITGADEFVKFGSVEALHDYFGVNPSPAVKDLLMAMNRFADAIKICRTSAIESELQNLGQHIKTFREHHDKDLKAQLFAKIIDTIEHEYGNLIGGASTRLDIIRWCIRKGFWQQALTLCTEWLPAELVNRKICTPNNSSVKKICENRGRQAHKTWEQYFIIDYKVAVDKAAVVENFCNNLRGVLKNFPSTIGDNDLFVDVKKFFGEYSAGKNHFELCQRGSIRVNDFKKKFPTFAEVLQAIYDERKNGIVYKKKNFYQFLQTIDHAKIPTRVADLSDEKLLELFKIDRDKILRESAEKSESKWDVREKDYRTMSGKKIISLKPDTESALKFLQGYCDIRNERNLINHADAQASKTIAELKPLIENYLAALEKIST